MLSSAKPDAGKPKLPRRAKKSSDTLQYAMFFVVAIVVVIVIAVVVTGTRKRPETKRLESAQRLRASTARIEGGTTAGRTHKSAGTKRLRSRERDRERPERTKERRSSPRTTVSSQSGGGYSRRKTTGKVLVAIIEESGVRYALIGDRRAKSGDEIDGRRIVDVGKDQVQVQFSTNTYTVKLGQPLY